MSELCVVSKLTPRRLKSCWTVVLINLVHLANFILFFLYRNTVYNAAVMDVPVLFFSGTLQAYRNNMSLHLGSV